MRRFEVKTIWYAEAVYLAIEGFRFDSGRCRSVVIAVLPPGSGSRAQQIAHPHQIVGRQCEGKHPTDSSGTPMASLAQAADSLEPAEDFFYPFAFLLADRVARMTSGALIDNAGGLARNMWSYLMVSSDLLT